MIERKPSPTHTGRTSRAPRRWRAPQAVGLLMRVHDHVSQGTRVRAKLKLKRKDLQRLSQQRTGWSKKCSASPLPPPPPPCDIPSGCCSFTGPWTVTRSSLRMLRRVAAFCRPLRPVLLLVSLPRSRSPVVGVLGLC